MADIERSVEIEQIDYNVDINNVSYSIDILPQNTYTIELNKQGPQGLRGYTGNGIESYELTSTAGLIDTYTITFTDGDTKTVNVTNGADGTSADITSVTATIDNNVGTPSVDVTLGGTELARTIAFDFHNLKGQDGNDGAAATISVGTVTTGQPTDPASVTNVGTSSAAIFDFTIPKGDKGDTGDTGATGNGVVDTEYISTSGLVDTYHLNFTNGSYGTFTVTNGRDGSDGNVQDVLVDNVSVLDGTVAKINLTPYLKNIATATDAISVYGTANTQWINGINIGSGTRITSNNGVAIGVDATADINAVAYGRDADAGTRGTAIGAYAKTNYDTGIAIGCWNANTNNAKSTAKGAYQFGVGTNSTARTLNIGWYDDSVAPSTFRNYQLLDGNTGLIPDARISSNIARASAIPTKTSDLTNDSGYISSIPSYYLQNNYTLSGNLAILGSISSGDSNTVVGSSGNIQGGDCNIVIGNSTIEKIGVNSTSDSIAIGKLANVNSLCNSSIAIGQGATCSAEQTIQLGSGTNNTAKSFSVGFINSGSPLNYQMLDGTTGLIPDSRISSNIARTSQIPDISNLADTDLSNLSATGQAVIDGQWVASNTTIQNGAKNAGDYAIDLSQILPNDNYVYECIFTGDGYTLGTNGALGDIRMASTLTPSVFLAKTQTRAAAAVQFGGTVTLVVGTDRVASYSVINNNVGNLRIFLESYRRIGTNS